MTDIETLGYNIKSARKSLGLTQSELAKKADIRHDYLGRIERVQANPSLSNIDKIAKALGLPTWLLFVKDID